MQPSFKRRKKLINPRMQLRLILIFFCAAGLAVQVEAVLIAMTMSRLAKTLPNDGAELSERMPEFVRTNLILAFLVLTPVMLFIGVIATFKICGPLYRFEQFLRAVRDGRQIEPCRIRKDDELQDFCTLLNEVTAPLRERAIHESGPKPAPLAEPQPALPTERRGAEEKSTKGAASERS
ncbi:MAG: hypothetical protein ACKVXR_10150 [Planctomycetota bacterium]